MRKLDIGIDLDGVCYNFEDSLRTWLHQQGRPLDTMPEINCWHFYEKQWGMTLDEFLSACHDAANAGWLFRFGDPRPGTVETLTALKEDGHRLHIITDRNYGDENISHHNTKSWLRSANIPYDTITFSKDKTVVPVDTMIDDRDVNYDALEAAGHHPWLMDRPWNQDHPGRRVYSWRQFYWTVTMKSALA